MKPLSKRILFVVVSMGAMLALWIWFVTLPRSRFALGMGLSEVERALGHGYELVPLGTALSAPPTPFELQNTPRYYIRVPTMAVTMHLNSRKEVIHIKFLLGEEGNLIFTAPTMSTNLTGGLGTPQSP
jgi:hypothetical protein